MRVDLQKFEQLLAEQGKVASDLRGMLAPATIASIRQGRDVSTRTVNKLAAALGVAPYSLQGGTGVVINRVKLMAAMAAQLLPEARLLELAGVAPADVVAIGNSRTVSIGTAWRVADTLGTQLEEIL